MLELKKPHLGILRLMAIVPPLTEAQIKGVWPTQYYTVGRVLRDLKRWELIEELHRGNYRLSSKGHLELFGKMPIKEF